MISRDKLTALSVRGEAAALKGSEVSISVKDLVALLAIAREYLSADDVGQEVAEAIATKRKAQANAQPNEDQRRAALSIHYNGKPEQAPSWLHYWANTGILGADSEVNKAHRIAVGLAGESLRTLQRIRVAAEIRFMTSDGATYDEALSATFDEYCAREE